ncbi:MAG: hypothetical protein EBS47_06190 [Betaproteobacteria bacterium]|nr:hypothetical protein [Betaproteobacteria bacterium]NBU49687.1 hypothetical protein [Betaproteobacteria bacterium]NBX96555.1 hypothetical protein [Betaproteobacteria bacterium]
MGTQLRTMLAAAFLSAAPAVCYSEGFSVSPVRLHLGERERAVALRLGNEAQKELRLKAELYAWSQDEQGRDHLQPSDDLVVSPPRLRVPAQGEQVVRLILAAPRNPERQMTYRLLLREERDVLPESSGSVPISLALSLPIFVTPTTARHALECGVQPNEDGHATAHCHNRGRAHTRVTRLELLNGSTVVARYEGSQYVLAGAESRIPLAFQPHQSPSPTWELRAQLDVGESQTWPLSNIRLSRAE